MLIIDSKVISPELFKEEFVCNLNACKGACCWEGDSGAPLETAELDVLENIYEKVKPFLRPEGIAAIEKQGVAVYVPEERGFGTTLIDNAACAYMTYEENGTAKCGIEKAHEAGAVDYPKPISCHLYPIRVEQLDNSSFEKLEYDRWDICSAACENGAKLNVPIYKFVKGPLIRKYGAEFYEQLEHMANHLENPETPEL
jgi:hypothetical protein